LAELSWIASKWEELYFLGHDNVAMDVMRGNSNTMSKRLKLFCERAKWEHITIGATHENAYIERRKRKLKGRELWVQNRRMKSNTGV
jgi:hypothetical protein